MPRFVAEHGLRLIEERNRLCLRQSEVIEATGITRTTQAKYEAGKNYPDTSYLQSIDRLGFDIQYIVTGRRGGNLTADHQKLVDLFIAAPESIRKAAFSVLLSSSEKTD